MVVFSENVIGHFRGVILVWRCTLLISALAIRCHACKLPNLGFLGSRLLCFAHRPWSCPTKNRTHDWASTLSSMSPPCLLGAFLPAMVINNIPILVVVVYHFQISRCLHMFDTIHQVVPFPSHSQEPEFHMLS